MTKHESHRAQQAPIAWSDLLTKEALASLPPNPTVAQKATAMQALVEKLQLAKQFEQWDPKTMSSIVVKKNYREVAAIETGSEIYCLQALPDGRIISGGTERSISIWSKGNAEEWIRDRLLGHTDYVRYLEALPDGRIISASDDTTIRIWNKDKDSDDYGCREVLRGHWGEVFHVQALPDGRIVSGSVDWTIRIWNREANGTWSSETLAGHMTPVNRFQVLPDGRIISGADDCTIRIWDGDEVDGGAS